MKNFRYSLISIGLLLGCNVLMGSCSNTSIFDRPREESSPKKLQVKIDLVCAVKKAQARCHLYRGCIYIQNENSPRNLTRQEIRELANLSSKVGICANNEEFDKERTDSCRNLSDKKNKKCLVSIGKSYGFSEDNDAELGCSSVAAIMVEDFDDCISDKATGAPIEVSQFFESEETFVLDQDESENA